MRRGWSFEQSRGPNEGEEGFETVFWWEGMRSRIKIRIGSSGR